MANVTIGFDGKSPPTALPAIGSFCPLVPFTLDATATTTSETITFPNLSVIKGWILMAVTSGVVDDSAAITTSASGNVLTIADGTGFDLDDANTVVYGLVWGTSKL